MDRTGTGVGVAALLNGNARKVTPAVVRGLVSALPGATVLISHDLDEARRHVRTLIEARPQAILSGGGDGAAIRLLNLWREEGGGPFPTLGLLRLGTGNGWARATGAPEFAAHAPHLAGLRPPLPTRRFDLLEAEGHLCHFAGVGWDARIINDYQRNLGKRALQPVGSRAAQWLHKGVRGYLYSVARITIPEEWALQRRRGQARATIENLGGPVYTLDAQARPVELPGAPKVLYDGPISVGAGATTPEWGYGFRAFPFCQAVPGYLNVRIYDRTLVHAVANAVRLWRGDHPVPGMHDWFATAVRFRFSRPMPFQIGGDAMGEREQIELRAAPQSVQVIDWHAALRPLR